MTEAATPHGPPDLFRALRFHGPGDLRVETVAGAAPAEGEVLVRVVASGVCGSDLHFWSGRARTRSLPVTLGHEIAGEVVVSRHPDTTPGDHVLALAGIDCGRCRACRGDRPMLCDRLRLTGIDFDGGLAEYVVLPGRALVDKPAGLAWDAAATACDAGATAFHAVACRGGVTPGSSVLIVGAGALGGYALQIAKLLGAAPVIAADVDPGALETARSAGADETVIIEPGGSLGRTVKLLTGGGVDVAAEFVGAAGSVDAAIKSIRPGGTAVVAGVGPDPLTTLPAVLWSNHEYEMRGSFGSHRRDLDRVLGWLSEGSLIAPRFHTIAFDDAVAEIAAAAAGDRSGGRLVLRP